MKIISFLIDPCLHVLVVVAFFKPSWGLFHKICLCGAYLGYAITGGCLISQLADSVYQTSISSFSTLQYIPWYGRILAGGIAIWLIYTMFILNATGNRR